MYFSKTKVKDSSIKFLIFPKNFGSIQVRKVRKSAMLINIAGTTVSTV